jgi:hypothetical protein
MLSKDGFYNHGNKKKREKEYSWNIPEFEC